MKKIRTVITDDDEPSRGKLVKQLGEHCPEVDVVAVAGSVTGGIKCIRKNKPELVILDIKLGDGQAFDLLTKFRQDDFRIIFVTARSEFAIKAFRLSAVDYLLKPVNVEELKEAIAKVRGVNGISVNSSNMEIFSTHLHENEHTADKLIISNIRGFEILKIPEIIICKADGYCTNFYLTGERKVSSSKNLKNYEELLSGYGFARVHHSSVININHVISFSKQGEIILSEGHHARVGNAYREHFLEFFSGKIH